jgi:hypothetical protein
MSDEPGEAESQSGSPAGTANLSDGTFETSCRFSDKVTQIGDQNIGIAVDPQSLAIGAAVAIYFKAFLEELGKRSGEGVARLPKLLAERLRVRREAKAGKPELHVGSKDDPMAAMIVVTGDMPAEAWLALLDLDVTAEAVRGKTLRWDATASAWLPEDEGSALPPIS